MDRLAAQVREPARSTARPRSRPPPGLARSRRPPLRGPPEGDHLLALTKLNVLSTFDELEVCVAYRLPDGTGRATSRRTRATSTRRSGLQTVPGWAEPLDQCATQDDLPEAARSYVELVERELGVTVELVGTGAAREQVLARS